MVINGQIRRTYQYDAFGGRLSQVNKDTDGAGPEVEETSHYGYNPHTDVETLTKDNGDTRATYGYTAYGKDDEEAFTGIDKPDTQNPGKEPYNFYRYTAKRFDPATGGYDMGFRDYNPGLNRFLTRDSYNGALADLNLGTSPWTGNRYAFTGGNPISNIELDGHCWDYECDPASMGYSNPGGWDPNHQVLEHGTTVNVDSDDKAYINNELVPPPAFRGPDPRAMAARVDALMGRPENAWYAAFLHHNPRFATFYMLTQVCNEDKDFCGKSYHAAVAANMVIEGEIENPFGGGTPKVKPRIGAGRLEAERAGTRNGRDFYHGSDVESLVDILNGGLDASKAAAKHTDGAGGFFMATHVDDAWFFATRRGAGGVIRIKMSNKAIEELNNAGGRIQSIPAGAKNAPNFQGLEFHLPTGAFGTFNRLMGSGDINVYAE